MNTAGPEIYLNLAFRLKILRVEPNFLLLPFVSGFNQQRIAKIIVMEVKRRFIVPVSIRLDDLPVGYSRILDEYVDIRRPFSIGPADKPFNRKPMVRFMRRQHDRREATHQGNSQDPIPPSQLTLYGLSTPHVL